jgi:PAS domain S-box-containing protein
MSWVTIIWAMVAATCLTMALLHLLIWLNQRGAWVNLIFAIAAVSVAGIAAAELAIMRAKTTEQIGKAQQWGHLPVFVLVVSIVGFIRLYFGTGRLWLGGAACAARLVSLAINFAWRPNLNFREVTALRPIEFLGETVSMPEGVANPWTRLGELSSLLLLAFVVDASLTLWRQGKPEGRRRAVVVGGSTALFIVVAAGVGALIHARVIKSPYLISISFLAIIAAMGLELVRDMLRAAQLAHRLQASQAALRESEERMSLAAEGANLGMWVWDVGSDEVWMTEKGRALFGFEPGICLDYAAVLARVHPDDRAARDTAIRRAIETQGEYAMEYRVLLPDGRLRWIGARGRCMQEGSGKVTRLLGVSLDVTAQKQAQDALRESEARFRTMANTAPVMIWMSGPDKLCTFFNKGWLDFTGRPLEQELGHGWTEGVHREDFDRCFEVYVTSFDAWQLFTIEYRLRRSDGEYRWVLDCGTPLFASDGTFLGYIGSCIDITERKRAEDRFRLVVEASPNGIVLVNAQGHIVLVNARAEKLFGYGREELIGQGIELLVPERFRGEHAAHRAGFQAAPATRAMGAGLELFARRKGGTEFPVEIGISPIQSPEGTLVLSVIVDISARRQAEAKARRHHEELAHLGRVAILGEMSASLAHELNQPLTGIVNNASAGRRFIAKGRADPAKLDGLLECVVADGRRAAEIIRGIRGMVRKGEEVRRWVNLNQIVADVVRLVHSDALGRHCAVVTEPAPELPMVNADPVQLQQVLLNIIVNAFDAMRETPPAQRRVIIRTERKAGGNVGVSVRDFGCGLPLEAPQRIFEQFFSTKPDGLGMGLAIARSIVAAHGGELTAENAASGGICVHFSLPAIGEDAA